MVESFDNLTWVLATAAEFTNKQGFSRAFIGCADFPESGVSFHGFHFVDVWDLTSEKTYIAKIIFLFKMFWSPLFWIVLLELDWSRTIKMGIALLLRSGPTIFCCSWLFWPCALALQTFQPGCSRSRRTCRRWLNSQKYREDILGQKICTAKQYRRKRDPLLEDESGRGRVLRRAAARICEFRGRPYRISRKHAWPWTLSGSLKRTRTVAWTVGVWVYAA